MGRSRARGTWGCQAPSWRRGGQACPLPRIGGGWMSPRPSSDGFPRHLPDKVSSTSSSSGPGPGGGGRQAFSRRLCSWRESLLSLLRAGPGQRPRPAPWCPTGAASSRPRGACPLVPAPPLRATEGSGYSGRGEARSGSVGASPAPQSQQQTERCRTDARAEVRTLGGVRPHPWCPAPRPGLRDPENRAEGGVLQAVGRLSSPAGLRGWGT